MAYYGYYSYPPPPAAPSPPVSQSNGGSKPPSQSNNSSPPLPPPPSSPPPPAMAPPLVSTPPSAPPPPPPSSDSPSSNSTSPPPPAPPPTPAFRPPPPDVIAPTISPPPPSVPSSPSPASHVSPPPPTTVPPPLPDHNLTPPPLAKSPTASSPPPPLVEPPISSSPPPPLAVPPPLANPPIRSPPPPVLLSPPPLDPQAPASSPLPLPPEVQPLPLPPFAPSGNISGGKTPAPPTVRSPPTPDAPPQLSRPKSPLDSGSKPSNSASNVTAGIKSNNNTAALNMATLAVVAGVVMLSLLGVVVWFVKKRRRPIGTYNAGFVLPSPLESSQASAESNYVRSPASPLVRNASRSYGSYYSTSDRSLGNSKSWFTYEELSSITNGFSAQNLLGQGGFGCVYKACLQDGREVAVKQLKVGGAQGEREFRAEVEIISRVHHRHLVSLVGYCISENQRLLVYDYVPNNTLHYHLHGQGRSVMDWAIRVKVAAGAARGIAYLHEDCHPRIIHRDIKSSNILLDNNFEAQVSDFGLARLTMDACTHVTTRVMGTFGYLAPEYASTGKLTAKSDVYSFGVVLLELVTGRKPVDISQPLGDESLVEWARPLLIHALESGEFEDLPDPKLGKNYDEREMFCLIEAAAACVRHSAAMRPRMAQVVRTLDSLSESDLNNGVQPGQSGLFNSAQHSAEISRFHRMAYSSQDYCSDLSRSSWRSRTDL